MRFLTDIIKKNSKRDPDKIGLIFENREMTFGEIHRRVNRLANAMLDMGIGKGDRVAILSRNCPEYLEFYFASAMMGAVPVGVNYRLTDKEIAYIVKDSEARILFVGAGYVETIENIKNELRVEHYISIEEKIGGMLEYESFIGSASDIDSEIIPDENDIVVQMYTSGTTGKPKGAMLSHRNMISALVGISLCMRMRPSSRLYTPTPLYHLAALGATTFTWMIGGTVALGRDFIPLECLQTIQNKKITHCFFVPAMIIFCLQAPNIDQYDFSSLETILYGASPFPIKPLKMAVETFGCEFAQVYGQTESTGLITFLGPEQHNPGIDGNWLETLASAGKEMWHNELRVVDEDDHDVEPGEVGEIIAHGANVMAGYWRLPEASQEALRDGWLRTGDLATVDEEGFVYIVDRKKDMIVSGAENVYPAEIEGVLMGHPAIAEAAVIGVPHETWGESVKAIVVLKDDSKAEEDEIIAFCRRSLGGFKIPRSVDFVGYLPRNPTGKVLKTELREKYWEGYDKRVH